MIIKKKIPKKKTDLLVIFGWKIEQIIDNGGQGFSKSRKLSEHSVESRKLDDICRLYFPKSFLMRWQIFY